MAQIARPTEEHRNRVPKIRAAYSASTQLQAMFPSLDAFVDHMLKADYDSSSAHQAEFVAASDFASYSKWAEHK